MPLRSLNNYIERISNLISTEEKKFLNPLGLQPIHLRVLNYLSISNKYSNTPIAVSKYLGNTKGTTSQSINLLEKRGYIEKLKSMDDKRNIKIALTNRGVSLLDLLNNNVDKLCSENIKITDAEKAVMEILKDIQRLNKYKTFGVCHSCKFFTTEEIGFRCGLTKEPLYTEEINQICFEHEVKTSG
ncbi:MAG: MarR family winged helix-turn-helix transcriptional regulator [Thermodesulfobacteriota bacterium]